MAINPTNFLFSQQPPIQGVASSQVVNKGAQSFVGNENPQSNNPFGTKNDYGIGLVNSNLANMSYKLPNGQTSTCNPIGIA